ncbi:NACHT domain-containing protein [Paraclostridium sordellii]|uniref:NACHT domain-containing protein n=1 Tax=Paraclostridium sordellii TaxID=1505 RepID=UPI0005E97B6A|nr:NACHT domain-containing protein [Paeniclostridium sordellii]CEN87361.1 Predicted NTPase (NACHT family) [[Clostridium] sordellii] [Paeniclostridium sordellii]
MNLQLEAIKAGISLGVSAGITELSKAMVNVYVKPKLEDIKGKLNKTEIDFITHDFTEYIERSYKKNLYINTIVFKNQQKTIDDLYIPLTVKKSESIDGCNDKFIEVYIDKYKDEFIPAYKKILLVDSAGMGKSTIMKYLYLSAIRQNKGIPILIELRKLSGDTSIVKFIMNEINGIRVNFNEDEIRELVERGDFIFFFDGYDEISNESKSVVTDNIQEFISKSGNNSFIISSRDENELNSFGDFQRFDVKRLEEEEVYKLIYKYDNNGDLSKELVDKLKTEDNLRLINEFLDNPLMVSLLYKAFEYKKTIPYKKHIFYRQVYDALFEDHDMSKGGAYVHYKKSKLDIEDFHKIVRYIAFNTVSKGVNYQRETLISIIDNAKENIIGIEFKPSDLIYDLTHSVPIFIKEGNQYRWVHKSFQDYFAASYIWLDSKSNLEKILNIISNEGKIDKYYNVLDFYYDMDYTSFTQYIILPILQDFEKFINTTYTSEIYTNYDEEEILFRKNMMFVNKLIEIKILEKEKINDLRNEKDSRNRFRYFFKENSKVYNRTYINMSDGIGIRVSEESKISTLIRLLNHKKSEIIINEYDLMPIFDLHNKLEEGLYIIDKNTYDDPKNGLNRLELFSEVNNYYKHSNCLYAKDLNTIPILNYQKCIDLKKEIEREISNTDCDFDFL